MGGILRRPDGTIAYEEDFFGESAFLTVSGQMNGEYYACALSNIYTFGPTFRLARHIPEQCRNILPSCQRRPEHCHSTWVSAAMLTWPAASLDNHPSAGVHASILRLLLCCSELPWQVLTEWHVDSELRY